jgi:hypothetical protein
VQSFYTKSWFHSHPKNLYTSSKAPFYTWSKQQPATPYLYAYDYTRERVQNISRKTIVNIKLLQGKKTQWTINY